MANRANQSDGPGKCGGRIIWGPDGPM